MPKKKMSKNKLDPQELVKMRGEEKTKQIAALFDDLAQQYDLANHLITLGQMSYWRRRALSTISLFPGALALDVGCGTGWVPRYLKRRDPGVQFEAIDVSEKMLAQARRRDEQTLYFLAPVENIPRHDERYHLVTSFFTSRNFGDLSAALREMHRVLKPHCPLVLLDTFPVPNRVWGGINRLWMNMAVPFIVAHIGEVAPYRYLAQSIDQHLTPQILVEMLKQVGFTQVTVTNFSLGAATCVTAIK